MMNIRFFSVAPWATETKHRAMHSRKRSLKTFIMLSSLYQPFLSPFVENRPDFLVGLIQRILQLVGLGKGSLLYTEEAVLLGMVYNFLPFMILQIQTSLSKMDNSLLEASADLGASPAQTFKRVTLPLSVPGIINGITLVFLPAVSSFFIPKLLGGGQYFLIGNMIENQFITVGEWNFGSAISMIMAVIMMVLMMVVRKIEIRNQGGKGV